VLGRTGAAVLFAFAFVALRGYARADDIAAGPTPIVNVQLSFGRIAFAVWNRPVVRIATDGNVTWRRLPVVPAQVAQINMWAEQLQTQRGLVALPEETFVLPPVTGTHDAIVARGYGDTTVTLPQGTVLAIGRISGTGNVAASGYQGTLVATTHGGAILVRNFTGTAFLQAVRGRIVALDSTFDRVRARSGAGPVIFSGCSAGQIDATSVIGAVIYDNGTLGEGPVHFASEYSNVGVGIATLPGASIQSVNGTATATLGAGGAVVTASSTHGTAFIYRGSLATHPELLTRWPRLGSLLRSAPAMRRPPPRFRGRPSFRRPPR
jgi:hypothetical protein